jgi:hypothetical protein
MKQRVYDIEDGFAEVQTFPFGSACMKCSIAGCDMVSAPHPPAEQSLPFIETLQTLGWNLLYIRTINGAMKDPTRIKFVDGHWEVYKYHKAGKQNTIINPQFRDEPLQYRMSRSWMIVHPVKQVLIRVCLTVEHVRGAKGGRWFIQPIGWFDAGILSKYMDYVPEMTACNYQRFLLKKTPDVELARSINQTCELLPALPFESLDPLMYTDDGDVLEPEIIKVLEPLRMPNKPCEESYWNFAKRVVEKGNGKVRHQDRCFYYCRVGSDHEESSRLVTTDKPGPWGEKYWVAHSEGLSSTHPRTEQRAREEIERSVLYATGILH